MPVAVLLLAMDFLCGLGTGVGHNMIHTKADKSTAVCTYALYLTHTHERCALCTHIHTCNYAKNHNSHHSSREDPQPRRKRGGKKKHNVSLTGFICFQFGADAQVLLQQSSISWQIQPVVWSFTRYSSNDGTSLVNCGTPVIQFAA